MSSTPEQLTVVFDGTCGFCTATVQRLGSWDRHQRITWIPCQRLPGAHEASRLCDKTVVSIRPDGSMTTSAQAFAAILGTITGSSIPLRIASLPVLGSILNLGYHGIARVRSHLPGTAPWCTQHPKDCHPAHNTTDS